MMNLPLDSVSGIKKKQQQPGTNNSHTHKKPQSDPQPNISDNSQTYTFKQHKNTILARCQ